MIGSSLEDIEAAALQLTPTERIRLAERRTDAFDRGEIGTIDFDEAIAQARARLTNRRAA